MREERSRRPPRSRVGAIHDSGIAACSNPQHFPLTIKYTDPALRIDRPPQDSGTACVAKLVKKLDLYGANIVQHLPMARMVAIAPVNNSILDSIVLDSEVELEPNCIIQLDDLSSPVPAQAWGIDRIDSRDGTDGFYDDSGVTGSGSLVYILDTGTPSTAPLAPRPSHRAPRTAPLAPPCGRRPHRPRRLWRPRLGRLVRWLPDGQRELVRQRRVRLRLPGRD